MYNGLKPGGEAGGYHQDDDSHQTFEKDDPSILEKQAFIRATVEDSISFKSSFADETENSSLTISKLRLVCSAVLGGLLGMVLSVAVNSVLFEISVNRVFSFYFGLVFSILGSLILMRAWTQPTLMRKFAVLILAAVVIGGGACSFVFKTEWLWWSSASKVFIYTFLGIATSFTITFSWIDIVSFVHDLAKRSRSIQTLKSGLIESQAQIWLLMFISVVTGLTYGLIFGLVQLEEMTEKHHSRQRLMNSLGRTELFSLPFGAGIGTLGAIINEIIRHRTMVLALKKEIEYKPLNQNDVDGI